MLLVLILNLSDFVTFIFTTKELASAALIFPIKARKRQFKNLTVSSDNVGVAASMKISLDFGEDHKPSTKNMITTHPDLFSDEEEVKQVKLQPDDESTCPCWIFEERLC